MLRYLSYPNRESVSISSKIFLLNYRISNLLLFQNKSAFLIGFNKWHDIDEEERTLEQIFLFQITTTQRICLNKLDKKGIILGAGLMEEFSYIYSNNPSFNYGLMIHLGYKF